MATPAVTNKREVTLADVTPLSPEKSAEFNEALKKYDELKVLVNTMQQSQARDSKRLAELRDIEKQALADLDEARQIQSLAHAKAAAADAKAAAADAKAEASKAKFLASDAAHQAAKERLKASNLKLLATVRRIAQAFNDQGTVQNMIGALCRMVFNPHFQTKPENRQADVANSRKFIEGNFIKQVVDSYCSEKWTYFQDKKCTSLSQKAVNDFVLPILNSPLLPNSAEVKIDLGGFGDEMSFDALLEIVKKAPKVTSIKAVGVKLNGEQLFSDAQLNELAKTVSEEKRKIPLVEFNNAAVQKKYVDFFQGRMSVSSKPLPPPPTKRTAP